LNTPAKPPGCFFFPYPREERSRAIAEIKSMRGGRFLSPGDLERVIDKERERLPQRARRRR